MSPGSVLDAASGMQKWTQRHMTGTGKAGLAGACREGKAMVAGRPDKWQAMEPERVDISAWRKQVRR